MKKKWIAVIVVLSLLAGFGLSFNSTTLTKFILYGIIHSVLNFFIVHGVIKIILSKKNKHQRFYASLGFGLVGVGILIITYSHLFLFPYLLGSNGTIVPNHFRTNTLTGQCDFGGQQTNGDTYRDPWYYKKGCTPDQDDNSQEYITACETACTDLDRHEFCQINTSKDQTISFCSVRVVCPAIKCPPILSIP